LTGNSFIQLLTAQLQAQDPLNPVDPTTFVTQLVQFNQLEQLININSTLSGAASSTGTSGSTPSSDSRAMQNFAASMVAAPTQSNTSAAPFQI
jgi:flagellar hook assembly protein FlgD